MEDDTSVAASNGHLDLSLKHEDDFESGEWMQTGLGFEALIVPQIGDRFVKTLDRVSRQFGVGRGRRYQTLSDLSLEKQKKAAALATAEASFISYRTPGAGTIRINGIEYPNTTEGRADMLGYPVIRERIGDLLTELNAKATELAAEEERALGAAGGN